METPDAATAVESDPKCPKCNLSLKGAAKIGCSNINQHDDKPQYMEEGQEYAIAYYSRRLTGPEQHNYSVPECELLSGIASFLNFYMFLAYSAFEWRTDSSCLCFAKRYRDSNSRLFRLSLLLDEMRCTITHMSATASKSTANTMLIADYLSRAYETNSPNKKTYKDVHDKLNNLIKTPEDIPNGLTIPQFYEAIEPYLKRIDKEIFGNEEGVPVVQSMFADEPQKVSAILQAANPSEKFIKTVDHYYERLKGDAARRKAVAFAPFVKVKEFASCNAIFPAEDSLEARLLYVALTPSGITVETLIQLQSEDKVLSILLKKVKDGLANDKWVIRKKVLMRVSKDIAGQDTYAIALPECLIQTILEFSHGTGIGTGHPGSNKMIKYIKNYYYWPGINRDVKEYCKKCTVCQYMQQVSLPRINSQDKPIPRRPNEMVCIDVVSGLPRSYDGKTYALICIDAFTKFVQGYPMANKKADTIASTFLTYYVQTFGMPEGIHSDQGKEVDSVLLQKICRITGARKSRTSAYHPQGDLAESAIKSVSNLLRSEIAGKNQRFWPTFMVFAINCYNTLPHSDTGVPPQQLQMGYTINRRMIPVIGLDSPLLTTEYYHAIRRSQEVMWQAVLMHKQAKEGNKAESKAKEITHGFAQGDLVMTKWLSPKAKGDAKLASRYIGPFIVLEAYSGSLVLFPFSLPEQEFISKDPDEQRILRLRGRVTAPEDCKRYTGPVPPRPSIDREVVRNFLRDLGLIKTKASDKHKPPFPAHAADLDEELGQQGSDDYDSSDEESEPDINLGLETDEAFPVDESVVLQDDPEVPSLEYTYDNVGYHSDQDEDLPYLDDTPPVPENTPEDSNTRSSSVLPRVEDIYGRTRSQTQQLRDEFEDGINQPVPSIDINNEYL